MLLVAIALAAGSGIAALRWWSGPPAWYRPTGPTDAAAARLAERVEYGLLEQVQRVRPAGSRWTIRITDEQANAWLAARLPDWWRTRSGRPWPQELAPPQIITRAEALQWAAAVSGSGMRLGVVGRVVPESGGPSASGGMPVAAVGLGRIGLRLSGVGVGRNGAAGRADAAARRLGPLASRVGLLEAGQGDAIEQATADPDAWVAGRIEAFIDRMQDQAAEDGGPGIPVPLIDGRRCRLLAVGLEDGAITMSFEAEGP